MKSRFWILFCLTLSMPILPTMSHADNGADRGGGELVPDGRGGWILRDFMAPFRCDWMSGPELAASVSSWPALVEFFRASHSGLAYQLQKELAAMRFCFTDAKLRKLPAESQRGLGTFEARTEQVAIWTDHQVVVNAPLYARLDEFSRAYFVLHEILHGLIPWNTPARIDKLRDFVATIRDRGSRTMPTPILASLARAAGIELGRDLSDLLAESAFRMASAPDAATLADARLLIEQGADVRAIPIQRVLDAAHPEWLTLLLANGWDPAKLSQGFQFSLHSWLNTGTGKTRETRLAMLGQLIDAGLAPMISQHRTFGMQIAEFGDRATFEKLLASPAGARELGETDDQDGSLLHVLIDKRPAAEVAPFLRALAAALSRLGLTGEKLGINRLTKYGLYHPTFGSGPAERRRGGTVLTQAVVKELDSEAIDLLIQLGADPRVAGTELIPPLSIAIEQLATQAYLGRDVEALFAVIQLLLVRGDNASQQDMYCRNPRTFAKTVEDARTRERLEALLKTYRAEAEPWVRLNGVFKSFAWYRCNLAYGI